MWWLIPAVAVLFGLVHLAKMARLYLVLMEHKLTLRRFLLLYCKTTFVNLVIPYKIGELYRIYKIRKETGHWQVGVLSVIIDLFFDMLALFFVLLAIDVFYRQRISVITGVFFIVLTLITTVYIVLQPTYTYLNRYFIVHKQSPRSMLALRAFELVRKWYDFSTDLIRGRFALITLSSLAGWMFEVLLLKCFSMLLASREAMAVFGIHEFADYVTSIFLGGGGALTRNYTMGTAAIFLVASVVMQVTDWCAKKKEQGAQGV